MRIFAIDDQQDILELMHREIQKAAPTAEIYSFSCPEDLLQAAREKPCDIAFLDIQMPDMDGMALAAALKKIIPRVNIIFASGYSEYKAKALDLRASGYIMKPVLAGDVREELQNLRYPTADTMEKRVHFRCFGKFAAFIDGVPVRFKRSRTMELLAYLVDSRGMCSSQEIMTALWEESRTSSYLRNLRKDLIDTFTQAGCEDVFIRQWNKIGIDTSRVTCDFYDWLAGKPDARDAYWGEYMAQYDWAEFTRRILEEKSGQGKRDT